MVSVTKDDKDPLEELNTPEKETATPTPEKPFGP